MKHAFKFRSSCRCKNGYSESFGKCLGKTFAVRFCVNKIVITNILLHCRCFPNIFPKFSVQLFWRKPVSSCFCNCSLLWLLSYSLNSFQLITANLSINLRCISRVSLWVIPEYWNILFYLIVFTFSHFRLEKMCRTAQFATHRRMIDSQFSNHRLVQLQLTTSELLNSQLTCCKVFGWELETRNLQGFNSQAWILEFLLFLYRFLLAFILLRTNVKWG